MVRKYVFTIIIIGFLSVFGYATAVNKVASPKTAPQANATAQNQTTQEATVPPPVITFEYTEYDFGNVDPNVTVKCDFKFKNTGESLLKIEAVQPSCGCVVTELKKKEFQPGESGEFSLTFSTGTTPGEVKKYVYVVSNDKKEPRLTCTIKANVVRRVQILPDPITLSLRLPNGGCPDVNVFSIDGKEFAITAFYTTPPNCMKFNVDPNFQAARFLIKPTVEVKNLAMRLRGTLFINTTHPQAKTIAANFEAPALYSTSPATLILFNAEPGKTLTRDKVWLTSNYNEDFDVESTGSTDGHIKATSEKVSRGRYSFNLQITPPPLSSSNVANSFTDNFVIKLKNGDQAEIPCRVFYARPKAAPASK